MVMGTDDWPPSPEAKLSELAAFDAMRTFLKRYWEKHGRPSDALADVLGDCQRGIWKSGKPGDPAMWSDWKAAVETVQAVATDLEPGSLDDPLDEGLG
jgi:hypothetical protein